MELLCDLQEKPGGFGVRGSHRDRRRQVFMKAHFILASFCQSEVTALKFFQKSMSQILIPPFFSSRNVQTFLLSENQYVVISFPFFHFQNYLLHLIWQLENANFSKKAHSLEVFLMRDTKTQLKLTGCWSFCHEFNQKQILSDLNEPVRSSWRRKTHFKTHYSPNLVSQIHFVYM